MVFNRAKYKDEFIMLTKEAIIGKSPEVIRSYFEAHPNLKPIQSLFVRKVIEIKLML